MTGTILITMSKNKSMQIDYMQIYSEVSFILFSAIIAICVLMDS